VDGALEAADFLARLGSEAVRLSPSETRVADVVLAHPEQVPRMTLASLAGHARVSEPTVLRFCRSLGLDGYPHFKIELARALAVGGAPYLHREIDFGDDLATVRHKVVQSSINALGTLQQSLDDAALAAAVARIDGARRLELFGVGLANTVASDAQQKFMRLDINCAARPDTHLQTMAAATLAPGDVAIAFSYNGRIRDILRSVRVARENGAFTIAVTRKGSPLAAATDLLLDVDPPEDTFIYAPMTTRLVHLAVVDLLVILVTQARGPGVTARFEHIKDSLSDQWIADGEGSGAGKARRRRDNGQHKGRQT
jgi:RpiR family carbohydrate utilization transcriptional regulator